MKQLSEDLYKSFEEDLRHCREKEHAFLTEVECCFRISQKYWAELRRTLVKYKFDLESEEIEFFKRIKPKFTSEIEYYGLNYHALMFFPDELSPGGPKEFWMRELKRHDKFVNANQEFLEYYTNDRTDSDQVFFVRKNNHHLLVSEPKFYYQDIRSASSHDHLITSFLALEKYNRFATLQLHKCSHPT